MCLRQTKRQILEGIQNLSCLGVFEWLFCRFFRFRYLYVRLILFEIVCRFCGSLHNSFWYLSWSVSCGFRSHRPESACSGVWIPLSEYLDHWTAGLLVKLLTLLPIDWWTFFSFECVFLCPKLMQLLSSDLHTCQWEHEPEQSLLFKHSTQLVAASSEAYLCSYFFYYFFYTWSQSDMLQLFTISPRLGV